MLQKARWGLGTRLVHIVVQFPGPAQLSANLLGEGLVSFLVRGVGSGKETRWERVSLCY